jgi:hypothetical protein
MRWSWRSNCCRRNSPPASGAGHRCP